MSGLFKSKSANLPPPQLPQAPPNPLEIAEASKRLQEARYSSRKARGRSATVLFGKDPLAGDPASSEPVTTARVLGV